MKQVSRSMLMCENLIDKFLRSHGSSVNKLLNVVQTTEYVLKDINERGGEPVDKDA